MGEQKIQVQSGNTYAYWVDGELTETEVVLAFPSWHPQERWATGLGSLHYLGRLGDEARPSAAVHGVSERRANSR